MFFEVNNIMKNVNTKNTLVFACTVPLLLLADMLGYIITHQQMQGLGNINNYKDMGIWMVQFFVYMFLCMTTIYLLLGLSMMIKSEKNNQKFWFIFLIVINLIFLWCPPDPIIISKEHLVIIVWLVTDGLIAGFISTKFNELKIKSIFKTIEVTETYHKYGKEIKKCEKTYPVLLPIIVAIISASGAIIASAIAKK